MASLKAKNEPEKEGTNLRKVTDAVPGNKKKLGSDTNWLSTIRGN
jgi:hypothetical protein